MGTDGVCLDDNMVATWMLCGNGQSVWTLTWLPHGCFVGTDGVCVDVNMVATWILWERKEHVWTITWLPQGCSVGTDGVCVDVNMVAMWMLCGNGQNLCGRQHGCHMDALWERTESVWPLAWLPHGCSVGTDGVCVDVHVAATRMLCGNGRSPCGH